ncbi:MAG: hypothetical protein JNG90_15760 [Planctomycetaceae bacterium]|nr:hypothetical protein [Planctomycetaceae bacterium]
MLASFRDLTDSISLHHNLFASSRERHPTLGGSPDTRPEAIVDFRNNVIYNLSGATNLANCRINLVRNVYRPGPNTPADNRPLATKTEKPDALRVYLADNLFTGQPNFTQDNWRAVDFTRWIKGNYRAVTAEQIRAELPFAVGDAEPDCQPPEAAYELVLQHAGASHPRDAADLRLVRGVRDRSHRLIDSQDEVGGWPELHSLPAPQDSDQDGMPDLWERQHGLDPRNADDRNAAAEGDGYTNLEAYLNELVARPSD